METRGYKQFYKLFVLIMIFVVLAIFGSCNNTQRRVLNERYVKNNVFFENENVGGKKGKEILKKIEKYAIKVNIGPINETFDPAKWEVVGMAKSGRRVDIDKTLYSVINSEEGRRANLVIDEVKPDMSARRLKEKVRLIGEYKTELLDRNDSRINNIYLASRYIDCKKLLPNEEFSFNSILGMRTKDKGYEIAPIIIRAENGYKKGYGIGGGICQLSTTIFNVARYANLKITERHIHTKDVGYIPLGEDATVSFGSKDFKFKNNKKYPIMIRVFLSSDLVTVKIFENSN